MGVTEVADLGRSSLLDEGIHDLRGDDSYRIAVGIIDWVGPAELRLAGGAGGVLPTVGLRKGAVVSVCADGLHIAFVAHLLFFSGTLGRE